MRQGAGNDGWIPAGAAGMTADPGWAGPGWGLGGCGRGDGLVNAPEANEGEEEIHESASSWHLGRVARLTAVVYTMSTTKAREGMDETWSGIDRGRWRTANRAGRAGARGLLPQFVARGQWRGG